MERRTFLRNSLLTVGGVLGGKEVGTYLAGGCTGCENIARQIAPGHLEKAYKMGLDL